MSSGLMPGSTGAESSRFDFVKSRHSGLHMFIKVTVIHPDSGIIRNHVDRLHLGGPNKDDVGSSPTLEHDIAMPVRSVQVQSFSNGHNVPADAFTLLHRHHWHIAVHESIDRGPEIGCGKT